VTVDADGRPHNILNLLRNGSIVKIAHHALFDFSFIAARWGITPAPSFCTKVAARIAGVDRNPTLQMLVAELLEAHLDKDERLSDWRTRPLTDAQVRYAASDVLFLHELHQKLGWRLSDSGRTELFEACMAFLPTRVELALSNLNDVFVYEI
jgi:ribonuclease D